MKFNGADLMVFLGGKSLAFATNHSVNINVNTTDTSTKDNGGGRFRDFEAGIVEWDMSSENVVSNSEAGVNSDTLLDLALKREKVDVVFGMQKELTDLEGKSEEGYDVPEAGWTPATNHYKGKAIITSVQLNAPVEGKATMTVSFTGCGALSKVANGLNTPTTVALSAGGGTAVAKASSK